MRHLLLLLSAVMYAQSPYGSTTVPRCIGVRSTECVPWVGKTGYMGIGLFTPATPLHVYSNRISSEVADSQIYSQWEFALGTNNAVSSVQGYYKNTGTNSSATSHGIGVLGKVEDTTSGAITLFGAEGRVDGKATSLSATHGYVGLIGAGIFQGASRGAYLYGVQSVVSSTTDGTTPLAQGTAVAYYAPAIIGGAVGQKYGIYVNDPLRTTDALVDGTTHIRASAATTPASGKGIEINYSSGLDYGLITSADRTSPSYKPLIVQGSLLSFYIGASPIATVNSSGIQMGFSTEPTCNSINRGTFVYVGGGTGVADTFRICRKDAANNYAWVALF